MNHSLLYVSECLLAPDQAADEVARLVAASRIRNKPLGVTGALLYTPGAFAQILEGGEAAIATLMHSIRRDPRHRDVRVIREGPVAERRFARWSMAYGGPSTYVYRHIEPLLAAPAPGGGDRQAEALARLMEEFDRPVDDDARLGPVGLAPLGPA